MRAATLLFAVSFAVSACVETSGPVGATGATTDTDPKPVSTARAVQLFDSVCGGSLANDFAAAKSLMARNGISEPSPAGTATVYSTTEDVSFQVQKGPGFGNTCSMVWGTTEPKSVVRQEVSAIGPLKDTDLGLATVYRGQRYLVLFIGGKRSSGPTTYYNLRLLSDN